MATSQVTCKCGATYERTKFHSALGGSEGTEPVLAIVAGDFACR
jgi:hypothetical protein